MKIGREMQTVVTEAEKEKGHHDGYHGDQECEDKEICECVGKDGRLQPATEGGERERERDFGI